MNSSELRQQPLSANLRPSRSSTTLSTPAPSSHPLRSLSRASNQSHQADAFASTSSSSIGGTPSVAGIRSRKQAASTSGDFASEATRPSLRRLTSETFRASAEEAEQNGDSANKTRRSFDELSRSGAGQGEREVVIHKLTRKDTIASISLQYGITPQALRLANRLWPSDSIHLRNALHIPLDQCHLPSSAGIERIVREDDGSLVVWEREKPPAGSAVLSPSARRAASAFEMGAGGSTYDLLGLGLDSGRSSLDSFREPLPVVAADGALLDRNGNGGKGKGKAPALLIDGEDFDAVSDYLPGTNNLYSASSPVSPTLPSFFGSSSINSAARTSPTFTLPTPDPPDPPSRPESADSHVSSSSTSSANPFANPPPASTGTGTLSRRTFVVERVPASALSFFPPPTPTFGAHGSSASSSFSDSEHATTPTASCHPHTNGRSPSLANGTSTTSAGTDYGSTDLGFSSFAPLVNSLARLAAPKDPTKPVVPWTKRWDIAYFGAEEEEEAGHEFDEAETWKLPRRERERLKERDRG